MQPEMNGMNKKHDSIEYIKIDAQVISMLK